MPIAPTLLHELNDAIEDKDYDRAKTTITLIRRAIAEEIEQEKEDEDEDEDEDEEDDSE